MCSGTPSPRREPEQTPVGWGEAWSWSEARLPGFMNSLGGGRGWCRENSLNQKSLEKFCDQSFEVSAGLDSMTRKVARREWARFTNIWKQGWGTCQKPGSPQLPESGQKSRERRSDLPPPPHHHKPKGSHLFDRGQWRGVRWVMWREGRFSGPWFPPLEYGLVFWVPKVSPVPPQGGWRAEGACGWKKR